MAVLLQRLATLGAAATARRRCGACARRSALACRGAARVAPPPTLASIAWPAGRRRAHPPHHHAAQAGASLASLVELLLHLRQLHQRVGQLLLVVLRRHRRLLVFQRIDLPAPAPPSCASNAALGRDQPRLRRAGAEANQREAGQQAALAAVQRRGHAPRRAARYPRTPRARSPGASATRRTPPSCCGVLERLERADRFVLVHVRRRIPQRFDPVPREHGRVLLRSALGCGDHRPARASSAAMEPPLELVVLTISCRRAAMSSHSCASSARGDVRPHEIELVFDAVVASHDRSGSARSRSSGLRLVRDRLQRLGQVRARRLVAGQRDDVMRRVRLP